MRAAAFCPAHVTGFFKAELQQQPENSGSMGAGFSINKGVTTFVNIVPKRDQKTNFNITLQGYQTDNTDVSKFVLDEFVKMGFEDLFFDIKHEISVPVGYGLGSSGAVALSLSYALNQALEINLDQETIGRIAHNAEVNCKTGLGDVLASYYGGFEIRTKPGAPGIGIIEKIDVDVEVIMICFSPISTNKFIKENLEKINGLGGKMVNKLLETKNYEHFQDMSLEFAEYVDIITPKMNKVIETLASHKIKCGVALFGETVFSIIPREKKDAVLKILEKFDGVLIKSKLDVLGARILDN